MAFFGLPAVAQQRPTRASVSLEFLHRHECAACPLNSEAGLRHPKMEPAGSPTADVYILGEAPDQADDSRGRHMSGAAGRILRHHIPEKWLSRIRWNNAIRCKPPGRAPAQTEIECCRPSIVKDIEAVKPKIILGFGNVPLGWALGRPSGIKLWSGLRAPIRVGSHVCWFFPILHPTHVENDPKWDGFQRKRNKYGSESEFQLALGIRDALAALDAGLPDPVIHDEVMVREGVDYVDGSGGMRDVDRVIDFLEVAATAKIAGLDYETNALRPYAAGAKILTGAVSVREGTLAFPFDHREAPWTSKERKFIDDAWRKFLYESDCRKIVHQLAFEMEWSAFFWGAECLRAGKWGCTLSQAYIRHGRVDEENKSRHAPNNLGALTLQYFGIDIKKFSEVKRDNLDDEPLLDVLRYNGPDAKYHRLLYPPQMRELKAVGQWDLYVEHVERIPTTVLTQLKGVPIDQDVVLELGKKYKKKMDDLLDEIRELSEVIKFERQTGTKFRPSAPEDVRYIINKMLGYKLGSVDETALESVDHEFARLELGWRKRAKIFGTYIVPVADDATREALEISRKDVKREPAIFPDGLLHPITGVNRTRTSRTSSEDPNYQNWPKRGANNAVEMRRAVKAKPIRKVKRLMVSFDYGQIQARNVGMESLDDALLEAFWEDYDIHAAFMWLLAEKYPRWIKEGLKALRADSGLQKKYRNDVKHGFVFASFFGSGAKKNASVLNIPIGVSEWLRDKFWDRFGGIRDWHGSLERDYYEKGYVTGLSGYRRYAPVSYNERINAPIQADESKIVLDAMERLSKLDHDYLQANMEIHDDLTFVWEENKVEELAPLVIREMLEVPFKWAHVTPIVVEMNVGEDWASLRAPEGAGFPDFGKGEFASHKYEGINMPRRRPK